MIAIPREGLKRDDDAVADLFGAGLNDCYPA